MSEEERARAYRRRYVARMRIRATQIRSDLARIEPSWAPKMSPLTVMFARQEALSLIASLETIARFLE